MGGSVPYLKPTRQSDILSAGVCLSRVFPALRALNQMPGFGQLQGPYMGFALVKSIHFCRLKVTLHGDRVGVYPTNIFLGVCLIALQWWPELREGSERPTGHAHMHEEVTGTISARTVYLHCPNSFSGLDMGHEAL